MITSDHLEFVSDSYLYCCY